MSFDGNSRGGTTFDVSGGTPDGAWADDSDGLKDACCGKVAFAATAANRDCCTAGAVVDEAGAKGEDGSRGVLVVIKDCCDHVALDAAAAANVGWCTAGAAVDGGTEGEPGLSRGVLIAGRGVLNGD